MTRRFLVGGGLALGASAAAGGTLIYRYPQKADELFFKDAGDQIEQHLQGRYGASFRGLVQAIEDVLRHGNGKTETERITPLKTFRLRFQVLKNLERALVVYPPGIFTRLQVTDFILADDVLVDGVSTDSVGLHRRDRATGYRRLIIQTLRGNEFSFDDVVHHEVGHAFTVGNVTEIEWAVRVYGSFDEYNTRRRKILRYKNLPVSIPWDRSFVSPYSAHTYKEDMAETLMYMYKFPQHVLDHKDLDSILVKKILFLKAHLEKMSDGALNERYWKDLASGKIAGEGYWNRRLRTRVQQ